MTPIRLRSVPFLLALGVATASPDIAVGQTQTAPRPGAPRRAPTDSLPADPAVTVGRLPNGITYYVRANREPEKRAELRLVVNAGSVLEDERQRGLAHWVEHMAFNGTRGFAKHEIRDYLERVGMRFGPDINAYTGFDETVYMLTLPTDTAGVLETGVRILEEWARGVAFDPEEVEKERGVVVEEWRLGQGAAARLRDKQFPVLFRGSRYAERLPIGTRESLEGADPAELRRFYAEWYRPELMAVVAVGDFDPERVARLIRERFGAIPASPVTRLRPTFTVPEHRETEFAIATDPEATGSSVSIYHRFAPREPGTVGAYRESIVESLFVGMLSDRLYERTQTPDAPFISASASSGSLVRSAAAQVLAATVRDNGVQRGLEALLAEAARAARHGFTPSELERQKETLLRLWEQVYAEREKTHSGQFTAEYVAHFLEREPILDVATEFELYRRFLPEITLEEVNRMAAERLRDHNRTVLVALPQKEGIRVPTEAELRVVMDAAARRPVEAYADRTSDRPLVPNPPTRGRVVSEREIPEIGVREWRLSNGVRVLLKPTDFKEDEILFVGNSPGGLSLAPDSLYVPALTATGVVQTSGVGELDLVELGKRLSGKIAGVGPSIGELREGFSGGGSPRDVETMLQLVYLYMTAPRVDTTAFLTYQARARESLRNRSASPEAAFQDTLRVTLAQNHPRARPVSSELFERMDLHRSLAFYRDRFADAGDFTFYFVGSFDPARLRPLVELYLGGLPSTGREESWRDVGLRYPRGVIRKTVRRGVEPKARTQIVFTGPIGFQRDSVAVLDVMAEVLQLRLRDVLREDLGGTYGVGVGASASRDPVSTYTASIGFGTAPERLEELTRVVFAEIDSLKRNGPREADLQKVREAVRRSRETDLRDNAFWLSQIATYSSYGWDLREILREEERVARLDAAAVRDAARRFLDTSNYVQVSLVPENVPAPAQP
ncbi:MAG TPA: insulinase family protein [Longimicrobiaceae bacterium]|nr:insulinase family protein [Longimicrobiaceae bacterium]